MDRQPNITVVYQDAPANAGMGCMEGAVSMAVGLGLFLAMTGWSLRDLVVWLWMW